jgi:hypothetical protein
MSSSFSAPRIERAQLDEVQTKRLDLRQRAVERGPIQNTCQQRVFTFQLGHRRLKGRQGGRAKVAGDPNRVQTRNLVAHVPMVRTPLVRAHRQDLVRYVGGHGKRTEFPWVRLLWSGPPSTDQPCADRAPVGWRAA